ncbi:uncharacterized protein METZ01_LOCUS286988, partial [marine metagenome]
LAASYDHGGLGMRGRRRPRRLLRVNEGATKSPL